MIPLQLKLFSSKLSIALPDLQNLLIEGIINSSEDEFDLDSSIVAIDNDDREYTAKEILAF